MDKTSNKFSPEVRRRAVRLVLDHEHEHSSRCAAITSVAAKICEHNVAIGASRPTSPGCSVNQMDLAPRGAGKKYPLCVSVGPQVEGAAPRGLSNTPRGRCEAPVSPTPRSLQVHGGVGKQRPSNEDPPLVSRPRSRRGCGDRRRDAAAAAAKPLYNNI
jgi:hypothetical protein